MGRVLGRQSGGTGDQGTMLSCSLSLCSGQSSFLTPISTGMGSHWLLLLLLLLSRDRAFNLPSEYPTPFLPSPCGCFSDWLRDEENAQKPR